MVLWVPPVLLDPKPQLIQKHRSAQSLPSFQSAPGLRSYPVHLLYQWHLVDLGFQLIREFLMPRSYPSILLAPSDRLHPDFLLVLLNLKLPWDLRVQPDQLTRNPRYPQMTQWLQFLLEGQLHRWRPLVQAGQTDPCFQMHH